MQARNTSSSVIGTTTNTAARQSSAKNHHKPFSGNHEPLSTISNWEISESLSCSDCRIPRLPWLPTKKPKTPSFTNAPVSNQEIEHRFKTAGVDYKLWRLRFTRLEGESELRVDAQLIGDLERRVRIERSDVWRQTFEV
ncbi:hypothetical protein Droror1_Dr00016571 [Drosera rotundifolia]